MLRRLPLALAFLCVPAILPAQQSARPVAIVLGRESLKPVPTLVEHTGDLDVMDQLFLRLAVPGPRGVTTGDEALVPQLAKRWRRLDPLTIEFELQERARWHDGTPVTAEDVVFALNRARNPKLSAQLASLLTAIVAVTAESPTRVRVRFSRSYPEQLYDAAFHVPPLPAHLLKDVPPEALAQHPYVQAPVGSGPYRWVRRVPGEFVELAAVPDFVLGRPGPPGVIFRFAGDPEARFNLLLAGDVDGYEAAIPPVSNKERLRERGIARLVPTPSHILLHLNFNHRNAAKSGPHPILGDIRVRRALVHALDRPALIGVVFDGFAEVPVGPASLMSWPREPRGQLSFPYDTLAARRLLAEAGWRDTDGDGVLERNGQPLELRLMTVSTSAPRRLIVQIAEQQWAKVGVRVKLELLDGPVWGGRRAAGDFDVSAESVTQDPTPSGLVQSWTCKGGSNVTGFCDPVADSLIALARATPGTSPAPWRAALRRLDEDAPSAFLLAPAAMVALNTRVTRPVLVPWSLWSGLWRWGLATN